jgi:hypothetical protein
VAVDFHRLDVVLLDGVATADRFVAISGLEVLELVVRLNLLVPELKISLGLI